MIVGLPKLRRAFPRVARRPHPDFRANAATIGSRSRFRCDSPGLRSRLLPEWQVGMVGGQMGVTALTMSHSGFRPPAGIGGAHSCGKSPNRAAPNEPGCLPGSCSVHRWPECDIVKADTACEGRSTGASWLTRERDGVHKKQRGGDGRWLRRLATWSASNTSGRLMLKRKFVA